MRLTQRFALSDEGGSFFVGMTSPRPSSNLSELTLGAFGKGNAKSACVGGDIQRHKPEAFARVLHASAHGADLVGPGGNGARQLYAGRQRGDGRVVNVVQGRLAQHARCQNEKRHSAAQKWERHD